MKKIYLRPNVAIKEVKHLNSICQASRFTSPRAEWGDQGKYAPDEWINEGHTGDGWPSVGIEEDEKDLWSR